MIMALRTLGSDRSIQGDYLAPLLNITPSPVRIATLNYGRSIEELAKRAGMTCDTGIATWPGGYDWAWDSPANIRLLKLHGSIDWVLNSERDLQVA